MLNWIECKRWRKRSRIICSTRANNTHLVVQRKSVWQRKTIWRHDMAIKWQCKMQLVCAYCVDISRVRTFISTENENRVTDASGLWCQYFFQFTTMQTNEKRMRRKSWKMRMRGEWFNYIFQWANNHQMALLFPENCSAHTNTHTQTHTRHSVLFNFFFSRRLHFFTKFRSHVFLFLLLRAFHSRTPSYENQIKHANKQTPLCD